MFTFYPDSRNLLFDVVKNKLTVNYIVLMAKLVRVVSKDLSGFSDKKLISYSHSIQAALKVDCLFQSGSLIL